MPARTPDDDAAPAPGDAHRTSVPRTGAPAAPTGGATAHPEAASADDAAHSVTGARPGPQRRRPQEWLNRPAAVWVGFAVVHVYFLCWMATFFLHGWAFSDTEQYREWAMAGYNAPDQGSVSPWVYPVLAQVPIMFPRIAGYDLYLLAWTLMITALNAVAMWFLLHRAPRSGVLAGWWWVVFTVFLGYLSFARVEGVAAPIVFIGLLYAVRHPVVGSALLSIATWIKVWPAAVLLAMVIALKQRVRIITAGVVVTLFVVLGVLVLGGIERIADFLLNQGSRGMQLEATFSTPWVWAAVLGLADSRIADNTAINSTEVYGPGVEVMASLMQPLLLMAVLVAAVLLIRALRRGADRARLVHAGSLLLTIVLIVFNKVGSPQFMIWLAPVIMVGLLHDRVRWRIPALLTLGIAATTFVIYPLFYTPLIHANPVMAGVLTLRNVLLVILLGWTVRRIWQLGAPAAAGARPGATVLNAEKPSAEDKKSSPRR